MGARSASGGDATLVLGPLLRHVGRDVATVWVEVDRPADVEVLGQHEPTFCVAGHHYAFLTVGELPPASVLPYEVRLDGRRVWPPAGGPPSVIRTLDERRPLRVLAGSCRQTAPHAQPWNTPHGAGASIGPDVLWAWARAMEAGEVPVPDLIVHVGDQVYADEQNAATEAMLEERRGGRPRPGWPQVSSFAEYTWLYHDAWSDPLVRWLLSTVPSAMVFDDHDVIDDWNTSASWRRDIQELPWWRDRITGALMAYWLYQHLGNADALAPHDAELLDRIRSVDDGADVLRAWAELADEGTPRTEGHRWSYCRDLGGVRLLVVDSRNGRVLDGERSMLDDDDWRWVDEQIRGGVDHLVLATSLPWLLPAPIHALEAWNERMAAGVWGARAARWGERLRRALDLEHWAAFESSFDRLAGLVRSVASGERGPAPATVVALSGDVHFSYVAEADVGPEATSRVRQVVASPMRHATRLRELTAQRLVLRAPVSFLPRALLRSCGGRRPTIRWRVTEGPNFENNALLLTFAGPQVRAQEFGAVVGDDGQAQLRAGSERAL